jgi:hypothetical protein
MGKEIYVAVRIRDWIGLPAILDSRIVGEALPPSRRCWEYSIRSPTEGGGPAGDGSLSPSLQAEGKCQIINFLIQTRQSRSISMGVVCREDVVVILSALSSSDGRPMRVGNPCVSATMESGPKRIARRPETPRTNPLPPLSHIPEELLPRVEAVCSSVLLIIVVLSRTRYVVIIATSKADCFANYDLVRNLYFTAGLFFFIP